MPNLNDLPDLLVSGEPVIACESPHQEKVNFLTYVLQHCANPMGVNCYLWNLGQRVLTRVTERAETKSLIYTPVTEYHPPDVSTEEIAEQFQILQFLQDFPKSGIFIVENLLPWLSSKPATFSGDSKYLWLSDYLSSQILNLATSLREFSQSTGQVKRLLLLGATATLSPELEEAIPVVVTPLPSVLEIGNHLEKFIPRLASDRGIAISLNQQERDRLSRAAAGLTLSEIESGLRLIATQQGSLTRHSSTLMRDYKIAKLKRFNIQFVAEPDVELGGLDLLQEEFTKFARLLEPEAQKYNLSIPKGVIMVGPPGTGKSYGARRCAQRMGVPLILADWGALIGITPAESEANLRRLLMLAESCAPVVLYFDDMDKGLAGFDSNADGGVARRLTGKLLTWMNDRTAPVLVLASVNRLNYLPPELTRAGRFDYLYFVDLPNAGERKDVFVKHLAKYDSRFVAGDAYSFEQWMSILKRTHKCSNSEVATIVSKAATKAYCEGHPGRIDVADLLSERSTINPLALRDAERITAMRRNAQRVSLPASSPDTSVYAQPQVDDIY